MTRKILLLIGALLILFALKPLQTISAAPSYNTAFDIINGVNAVRASYGLPALEVNTSLMDAAKKQSDYQASIAQGTHTGEGGTTPSDRAKLAGYGSGAATSVSENIFSGAGATPAIAVSWWAGDALHLQTMIGPYKHIGAGLTSKNGVTYLTLLTGYLTSDPGTGADPGAGNTPSGGESGPPFIIATPREDGSIIHIVGFGQTLWTIATNYGLTVEELLALNNLTEASIIYPGDELVIQLPTTGPTFTPSGPTFTPAPTTPTITPTATIRPTRTPRPTLPPTAGVTPQATEASAETAPIPEPVSTPEQPLSPDLRGLAQPLLLALILIAGGLFIIGNLLERRKKEE